MLYIGKVCIGRAYIRIIEIGIMMEITFLGTSSGTPTKSRNVSGAAVGLRSTKKWFLVDCGEATQHQILHTRYSLNSLQAIFITHVHGDHCYGLPGLLASAAMAGRTEPLKVICPKGVEHFMQAIIEATQLHFSYSVEFIDSANIDSTIIIDGMAIDIIALSHRVDSFGFRFTDIVSGNKKLNTKKLIDENIPKGDVWGRIQKGDNITLDDGRRIISTDFLMESEPPQSIIICGDNDSPELLKPYMTGVSLVVHESTYTEDVAAKVGPGPQHSYAKRVAQFAQDVALKNLILTHFSPRYSEASERSPSMLDIEREAKSVYSGNLFLAKDFDCYQLDSKEKLSLERAIA